MAQHHPLKLLAFLDVPVFGQPAALIHVKDALFGAPGGAGEKSIALKRPDEQPLAHGEFVS